MEPSEQHKGCELSSRGQLAVLLPLACWLASLLQPLSLFADPYRYLLITLRPELERQRPPTQSSCCESGFSCCIPGRAPNRCNSQVGDQGF
jgi:hypothetical protein